MMRGMSEAGGRSGGADFHAGAGGANRTMAANRRMRRRNWLREAVGLILLALLLAAVCLGRLMVGESLTGGLSVEVLRSMWEIRQDRLLAGLTVGAALSVGGVLLQAMLRNPLASPYLLGISGGAAVGVQISRAGLLAVVNAWLIDRGVPGMSETGAALIGAWGTLIVVYLLSQRRGWVDPLGLVLVGVVVTSIAAAAIMFIHVFRPSSDIFEWMMGYFNESKFDDPAITLNLTAWGGFWATLAEEPIELALLHVVMVVVAMGVVFSFVLGRAMDVATLNESEAASVGLNVGRLRLVMFMLAGMMTSMTVVLAGPIGFVGLIGPHVARLLMGPRHRPLVIGAALIGAALVVGADTVVRLVSVHFEGVGLLPLGAVMSVVGGPLFVLLLRRQLGRGGAP